uniref:Uncharacterized protein n=1 Tax=Caenorhabditis tropicalis TaxID=1561998 RepID=A0A1I7UA69_9PELO
MRIESTRFDSSSASSESAKIEKNLVEIVEILMKRKDHRARFSRHAHHKTHCGKNALRRIGEICSNGCTQHDDVLVHELCTSRISDDEIKNDVVLNSLLIVATASSFPVERI